MFSKILVPTDGSEFSRRALITAVQIARSFNSAIELLHVVNSMDIIYGSPTILGGSYTYADPENIGKQVLDHTIAGLDIADVTIAIKTVTGSPADAIIDELKQNFDLVVMGSKGHSPLHGALIGSVTQRVAGETHCPVLIVKND